MSEAAIFEPDPDGEQGSPAQQIERRAKRNARLRRSGRRMRARMAAANGARRRMRPSRRGSSAMARAGAGRVARMTPMALLAGTLTAVGLVAAGRISGKKTDQMVAEAKDFLFQGEDLNARASGNARELLAGNEATAIERSLNGASNARQRALQEAFKQIELRRVTNQRELEKQFGVENWLEQLVRRLDEAIRSVLLSEDSKKEIKKAQQAMRTGFQDRRRSPDHKESPR